MIAQRLSQDNTEFKAMLDYKARPCFKQQLLKTHTHTQGRAVSFSQQTGGAAGHTLSKHTSAS